MEEAEEGKEEEQNEDVGGDVAIAREASGSPPAPPPDTLQLTLQKGKNNLVLASDSGLKNDQVVKSLRDGTTLAKDLKLFNSCRRARCWLTRTKSSTR